MRIEGLHFFHYLVKYVNMRASVFKTKHEISYVPKSLRYYKPRYHSYYAGHPPSCTHPTWNWTLESFRKVCRNMSVLLDTGKFIQRFTWTSTCVSAWNFSIALHFYLLSEEKYSEQRSKSKCKRAFYVRHTFFPWIPGILPQNVKDHTYEEKVE